MVVANILSQLPAPVVVVDSTGTNYVAFSWAAIPGATGYEVSVDNGATYNPPSSGATGLSHIVPVSGPLVSVTLIVRVLGDSVCQANVSTPVTGTSVCSAFFPQVVASSLSNCANNTVTFDVQNPGSATHTWYSSLPPVTPIATGNSFTTPPITVTTNYWVVAVNGACTSNPTQVTAVLLQQLVNPVITVTGTTSSSITFSWTPVPGAVSYEVRVSPSTTPIPTTATTYTVTGLAPLQSATISVTAVGNNTCQNSISSQTGQTSCPTGTTIALPTDTLVCSGATVTFRIQNPIATATYRWYDVVNGGTALVTGTTFTRTVSSSSSFWVETEYAPGCISPARVKVNVTVNNILATPIVKVTDSTSSSLTFGWNSVPGAIRYEVIANGVTTSTTSLTFTILNLGQLQTVSISVRAIGALACQTSLAGVATGKTLNNQVFIPNTFMPNSSQVVNQTLRVFSNVLKEGRMMIFNQWGEKIYESNSISDLKNKGWNGTYKGKLQPVGVYIYVAKFTLTDGSVIDKKGSINLIR